MDIIKAVNDFLSLAEHFTSFLKNQRIIIGNERIESNETNENARNSETISYICGRALAEENHSAQREKIWLQSTAVDSLDNEISTYLSFFADIYNRFQEESTNQNDSNYIEKIDAFFRDTFFTVVNNPIVQKRIIYPHIGQYGFLLDLYDKWTLHIEKKELNLVRDNIMNDQVIKISEYYLIPYRKYDLIEGYIAYIITNRREFNFHRTLKNGCTGQFKIKQIRHNELDIYVNKVIMLNMPENDNDINDESKFLKSTREEIEYAIRHEYLWVIETDISGQSECIAAAIFLSDPHKTLMNGNFESVFNSINALFQAELKEGGYTDNCGIFDSVIVRKDYRGFGFQRLFQRLIIETAVKCKLDCVIATISEENRYSFINGLCGGFEDTGYRVTYKVLSDGINPQYYDRHVICANLK